MTLVLLMCQLTGTYVTHSWLYNNQLTKVCEYRCTQEQSLFHYHYPDRMEIPWDSICPESREIEDNK